MVYYQAYMWLVQSSQHRPYIFETLYSARQYAQRKIQENKLNPYSDALTMEDFRIRRIYVDSIKTRHLLKYLAKRT